MYDQALQINPTFAEAYFNKGNGLILIFRNRAINLGKI